MVEGVQQGPVLVGTFFTTGLATGLYGTAVYGALRSLPMMDFLSRCC